MNTKHNTIAVIILSLLLGIAACKKESTVSIEEPTSIETPDPSDTIFILKDSLQTIGIYADNGAAPSCVKAAENMFQWMNYNTKRIYAADINGYQIADIDIFYFPGGSTDPYMEKITEDGKNFIRFMIKRGCGYIGTCAGANFACEVQDWGSVSNSSKMLGIFPGIASGPNTEIFAYPEIGMCKLNLNNSHQITNGLEDSAWIMYYNGPFFDINEDSDATIIGSFDITGGSAIVACEYGNGRVFLTSPHPEWEEDDNRDGVSYFDSYNDQGSDWPLMKNATDWCMEKIEE